MATASESDDLAAESARVERWKGAGLEPARIKRRELAAMTYEQQRLFRKARCGTGRR